MPCAQLSEAIGIRARFVMVPPPFTPCPAQAPGVGVEAVLDTQELMFCVVAVRQNVFGFALLSARYWYVAEPSLTPASERDAGYWSEFTAAYVITFFAACSAAAEAAAAFERFVMPL